MKKKDNLLVKNKSKFINEKAIGFSGSVSGATSFLGSYQVCHNLCLWLITLLSLLGITVVGMPLLFLTKVAVPFWTVAFILLLISLYFYYTMKCISKKLLLINTGLIIAGIPFKQFYSYRSYLMIIGTIFVIYGIFLYFKDKYRK